MPLLSYASLDQLKSRNRVYNTDDDERYKAKLFLASRQLEVMTGRVFLPWLGTHSFDWYSASKVKFTGADLLALTGISDDGGAENGSDVILLSARQTGPYYGAELLPSASFQYQYTSTRCIDVVGVWGYHLDSANAWIDTLVTVPIGGLTDSALSMTLSAVAAADGGGIAPAFQTLQLLKIDSEYLWVTGVSASAKVVSVQRGVQGTTAAAHTAGAAIYRFDIDADIKEACLALAAFFVSRDDTDRSADDLKSDDYPKFVTRIASLLRKVRVA